MNNNKFIKLNWPFFVIAILIPLVGTTIAIMAFYPLVDNQYANSISSPEITIIGIYILMFIIVDSLVAYIAIPYLVTVKGDIITFDRLRRKLKIDLKNIDRIEIHGKLIGHKRGHSISFIRKDGERIIGMGLSYGITLFLRDYLKKMNMDVSQYHDTMNNVKSMLKEATDEL